MRTPMFHAVLRQEFLRQKKSAGPSLAGRYHDFFYLLHRRAYNEMARAAAASAVPTEPSRTEAWVPPFLAQLRRLIGDAVPPDRGPVHDPATDGLAIASELGSMGVEATVPPYAPHPGWRGAALSLQCYRCSHKFVSMRPYAVDLLRAPELEHQLRDGVHPPFGCPRCGNAACGVVRTWIEERPGAGDPLLGLCCVWRPRPSTFFFTPPPGTVRNEEYDRILEIRFGALLDRTGWLEEARDDKGESEASVASMAVAYSIEELSHYLARIESPDDIPFAMRTMIDEFTRKVRSGLLPLADAVTQLRFMVSQAGAEWPLIMPGDPARQQGEPLRFLIQQLVAESVARAKGVPKSLQVMMAASCVTAFMEIGETAMAEAELARAEDLLGGLDPGEEHANLAQLAVTDARASLNGVLGRDVESDLDRLEDFAAQGGDSARFARLQIQSTRALMVRDRGQLAQAMSIMMEGIAACEQLLAGQLNDATGERRAVQHVLSGELANLAAVLTALPQAPTAEQEAAQPLLGRIVADPGAPQALVETCRVLLTRALELSSAQDAHEFAGIQAHRLALILRELGRIPESVEVARTSIRHASQVGDHLRVWTMHGYLAQVELDAGRPANALQEIQAAALDWIRRAVGQGYGAHQGGEVEIMADFALQCAGRGANPGEAILVAESLKAAVLGASLSTGEPGRNAPPEARPLFDSLQLQLRRREGLRLQRLDGEDMRAQLDAVEAEIRGLRTELSLRDPQFARWVDATDVQLADAESFSRRLAILGPRSTLLGILLHGDSIWSYALWAEGAIVERRARDTLLPGADEDVLSSLSRGVLEPLAARLDALHEEDRVIVSVCDGFWTIPFAALPYRGRPLSDLVTLSFIQGIDVLEACLDRAERPFDHLLCIGDPARPDAEPLSGALEEARLIETLFRSAGKSSTMLGAEEATVAGFREKAPAGDVLHLACHADTSGGEGGSFRLLLAPDPSTKDSGDLSEDRIRYELRLQPGCLVNLAACATAQQAQSDSPLYGGLVTAFLLAGASSVMATLWPIGDQTAAVFQEVFYRHLLGGARPAESLVATQRACIAGRFGPALQSPMVWAAYVVWGRG